MTSPIVFEITNYLETDSIDLSNDNPKLISGSFSQNLTEGGELVTETFRTIAVGTTRAVARASIIDLERLLNKAPAFHKYLSESESIWLKASNENETARRTLIYSWSRRDISEKVSSPLQDKSVTIISQWTIERHAYWEALPANTVSKSLTGLYHSGEFSYSELANANDYGSAPARIAKLTIPWTTLNGDGLYNPGRRLYIGYHPKQDPSNWLPSLYIGRQEYWSTATYGTRNHVEANTLTSQGCCHLNFGSGAEWVARTHTSVPYYDTGSPTPNPLDEDAFAGKYLVLLRARMTSTNTIARIAMALQQNSKWGVGTPTDLFQELYIQESDTNYHLYEMGVIQIPPEGYRQLRRDNEGGLRANQLTLVAERLSGTGDMFVDSYIFIPYSHFISLDSMQIQGTGGLTTGDLYIIQDEDDIVTAYLIGTNWPPPTHRPEPSINDWHIPPYTQGTWVAALDCVLDNSATKALLSVTLEIYPRYFSYNDD